MFKKFLYMYLCVISLLNAHENAELQFTSPDYLPNTVVLQAVDIKSGTPIISEEDLVVNGVEPIHLTRTYVDDVESSIKKWEFFSHIKAIGFYDLDYSNFKFRIIEPSGLCVEYEFKIEDCKEDLYIASPIKPKTPTNNNCSDGILSGRNNHANDRLHLVFLEKYERWSHWGAWEDNKGSRAFCLELHKGDGSRRRYHIYKRDKGVVTMLLSEEVLPNGNKVFYEYSSGKILNVKTTNPKGDKTYASLYFNYINCNEFWVETSDKTKVHYLSRKLDNGVTVPSRVEGDIEGVESFGFDENWHKKSYTKMARRYISKKPYCYLSYFKEDCDRLNGKIKRFSYTSGAGKLIKVASFEYPWDINFSKVAVIKDPDDAIKKFYFGGIDENLAKVERYISENGNSKLSSRDNFVWVWVGPLCYLHARFFEDANGNTIFAKDYVYDSFGNVVEDRFSGNLTGSGEREAYSKKFAFSKDGFNLPIKEEHDNGLVINYSYLPGTNLITKKLTGSKDKILLREFFEYNEDNILVKKISDDGSQKNHLDLTNVTYRLITYIHPKKEAPAINMPEVIEEKFLNLETGEEQLLKKQVLHYSNQNWIIGREFYDSNDVLQYVLKTSYNSKGRVISESNPLGQVTYYEYDLHGNIIKVEDPSGFFVKEITYDNWDRPIQCLKRGLQGSLETTSTIYDNKNNKIATTDILGNTTRYMYDCYGNCISKIESNEHADESIEKTVFDCLCNPVSKIDSNNCVTNIKYNAYRSPTEIEHPHYKERFSYNKDGTLKVYTNANDVKTYYTYDILSRQTSKKIFSKEGNLLSEEYMEYKGNNLVKHIDPSGVSKVYTYDNAGRKVSENYAGIERRFSYDSMGRLSQIISDNIVEEQDFDLMGRVVQKSIKDSKGNLCRQISYTYNSLGLKTEVIIENAKGKQIYAMNYDDLGRMIAKVDPLGNITHYHYQYVLKPDDKYVLEKTTTDPEGLKTIEEFNSSQKLVSSQKISPFGICFSKEDFFYNANGQLQRQDNFFYHSSNLSHLDKTTIKWEYNKDNFLVAIHEAFGSQDQKTTRFSYTNSGLLQNIIRPDGTLIENQYDNLDRVCQVLASDNSYGYKYKYDPLGRAIEVEDLVHGGINYRFYSPQGSLVKEVLQSGLEIQNEFDSEGRRTKLILPDNSSIVYNFGDLDLETIQRFDNNENERYSCSFDKYDLSGNLIEYSMIGDLGKIETEIGDIGTLQSKKTPYSFEIITKKDRCQNILEKQTQDGVSVYSYDDIYQIYTEDTPFFQNSYTHCSHHARLSKNGLQYTLNALHQVVKSEHSYSYNLNGCRIKKDARTFYKYDALDRLTSIEKKGQSLSKFTYDVWGRRISKVDYKWQDNDYHLINTQLFIYDGDFEIGVTDAEGKILQLRLAGRNPFELVSIELNEEIFAPIQDLQGNLINLVALATKDVAESYSYSCFGEEKIWDSNKKEVDHSLVGNPWRFMSKRIDESGLIYFGQRYFDREIGSWLTCDPGGFINGINLYTFALANSLSYTDFYGLAAESIDKTATNETSPSVLERVIEFTRDCVHYLGETMYQFSRNCVPVPFVRQILMRMGQALRGRIEKPEHSGIICVGHKKPEKDSKILLVNGIMTSKEEAMQRAEEFSKQNGDIEVYCGFNSSQGFILDILECICGVLGFKTHSQEIVENFIKNNLTNVVRAGGKIQIEAFSQGGIIVNNVWNNLSSQMRRGLEVKAYGSPVMIRDYDKSGNVKNIISTRDFVPMLSPIQYIKAKLGMLPEVSFVDGHGVPLCDHSFYSKSYSSEIEMDFLKFRTAYGAY